MSKLLDEMNELAAEISVCKDCMLHLTRDKAVPGEGNVRTKILFIGEGPGANENATGRPFVGQAGNFLNHLMEIAQVKRQEVFITNVVKCRPPSNRDPGGAFGLCEISEPPDRVDQPAGDRHTRPLFDGALFSAAAHQRHSWTGAMGQ